LLAPIQSLAYEERRDFWWNQFSINRAPIMTEQETPKRKLNADQKHALRAAKLNRFVQDYGRQAQKGVEPNDRKYEREVENEVKRMKPEELDRLLRDDEEA
jgi:hypothetical protein